MPRPADYVPRYRKHKQSGQAIVTLCGKDFLLGPHGTQASRNEYDRLNAALEGLSDEEVFAELRSRPNLAESASKTVKQAELETLVASKGELGEDKPDSSCFSFPNMTCEVWRLRFVRTESPRLGVPSHCNGCCPALFARMRLPNCGC